MSQPAIYEVVERVRKRIIAELENLYSHIDLPDLVLAADGIEEIIKAEILRTLIDESEPLFRCVPAEAELSIVDRDGNRHAIRVGDDLKNTTVLAVTITVTPEDPTARPRRIAVVRVKDMGRFKIIRVYATRMWSHLELLTELLRTIPETAYAWYRRRVEDVIRNRRDLLAENLYGYLRSIIPHEEARANVWFASVLPDWGFRLLDVEVARAAFQIIDRHSHEHGFSTTRLTAELLTKTLPREKLLMKAALTEKRCIDADLRRASYKKEGSSYASTLEALYGGEQFSVYPVTNDEKFGVVVLFPVVQRSMLEPLLDQHREELQRRSEETRTVIKRTLAALRRAKRRLSVGTIAEAVGGLIKGYFGSGGG